MVRPPAAGASPVPSTPDAGHQPSKHHFSAVAHNSQDGRRVVKALR